MGSHLASTIGQARAPFEEISGLITIGATGAPTITYGKGFSIARSAAGRYTVTLKRSYRGLLSFSGSVIFAAYGTIADYTVHASNVSVADTSPTFMILCMTTATLTELVEGDQLAFTAKFATSRLT